MSEKKLQRGKSASESDLTADHTDESTLTRASEGASRNSLVTLQVPTPPQPSTSTMAAPQTGKVTEEKRRTRNNSPSTSPSDVQLKILTQRSRLDTIKNISTLTSEATTLDLLEVFKLQASETHKAFVKEHSYLEDRCITHLNESYFSENIHSQESMAYLNLLLDLAKREAKFKTTSPAASTPRQTQSFLPRIQIPTFAGEYTAWPNFKGLFSSLVLDNANLSKIEKFHYLTNALKGSAADVIASLPMTEEAFETAWDKLQKKYENKRKLVSVQLDMLFKDTSKKATSPSAHLTELITRVDNALSAIQLLGQSTENWDAIIAYLVTKQLDDVSKERWESLLGDNAHMPTYEQLKEFIATRIRTLENLEPAATTKPANQQPTSKSTSKASVGNITTSTSRKYTCDCCDQSHFIVSCQKFRGLQDHERLQLIRKKQLCYNCMGRHSARACRMQMSCTKCSQRHHTMLHDALTAERNTSNQPADHNTASTSATPSTSANSNPATSAKLHQHRPDSTSCPPSTATLLATALARIRTSTTSRQVRILIDQGSEISIISQKIVNQLNIERQRTSTIIIGIGGTTTSASKGIVSVQLQSMTSPDTIKIRAHIMSNLTTELPSQPIPHQEWPHIKKLTLADDSFLTPQPIDIIIGANYYGQVIKPNIIKLQDNMPIAQLSIFGWLILGQCGHTHSSAALSHHLKIHEETEPIQDLLAKFWVQEEVPVQQTLLLTPEEQECERHFKETHQRHSSGKYIVKLPLSDSRNTLGDSYHTALNCLRHLQKRLNANAEYQRLYENFMTEYIQLGHMVKAECTSPHINDLGSGAKSNRMTLAHDTSVSGGLRVLDGKAQPPRVRQHQSIYYLPHHGVLRPESTSTKLRVVFNGSKATTSGLSLNDIMHTGAKIQKDITDVLLWMRKHKFIFTTDVTKMYRQIMVHEDDWDLQRILWFDEKGNITPYNLTTVTYGTRSAPFLAIRALLQLTEDEGHNYPLAVDPITKGRYVDDIIGGADSPQQLIKIANQLDQLCKAGGLPLAKWQFNDSSIAENIRKSNMLALPTISPTSSTISFGDCTTKILGITWHPATDHFTFTAKNSKSGSKTSKRRILSEVAQIYDPLGFLSPIIIRAKVLLQELWLLKSNWDDPLPLTTSTKWKDFKMELSALESIKIPRWTRTLGTSSCELHGFSDASQLAMAAVVYLRVTSQSGTITTSLLCAKTKVAPLTRLTIPRLELAAALLLAKLIKYAQATIEVNVNKVYLWTDSLVTLTWIRSHPSKWKDFVRNRVSQIQEITSTHHWMHVPGKSNPADCASRGTSTKLLIDHSLWWTGPPWLSKSPSQWPAQPTKLDDAPSQEARPGISQVMTMSPSTQQWDLILRYSNFTRLVRVTSLVMRACDHFKGIPRTSLTTSLSPSDLDKAKQYWIRSTQQAYFKAEIKIITSQEHLPHNHVLNKLTAYIDSTGIMRVGGRLENSSLDPDSKHPVILPRHSPLSNLIIDQAHQDTLHGGTQITLATIRQQYWIIGGRAPVRSHILRCIVCARYRGDRAQQLMGQLPISRVTISRPFQHTGVDYAGPINVKSWKGRGSKTYKSWICLFTCMVTSAVHLEVVTDYATDGFLAAYRRFTSRRGICQALYSDCGKNFIGADAELKKLFTQASKEHQRIANIIANDTTQWHFNPPSAPHMGGKWESVVKSIKFHLRRSTKDVLLTLEEFTTLLTQIEGILNSRPIEPLSDDPNDLSALTPGHFITGSAITSIPEPSLNQESSPRTSWQKIQQKLHHFWQRWSTSVLQRHLATTKWHHKRNDITLGSLVLLTDERFPPSKWPLARVIKLHPGEDGLTRVVTIKTASTTLTRPIAKLAILPNVHQDVNITQDDFNKDHQQQSP